MHFLQLFALNTRGAKRGKCISYNNWNSTLEALNEVNTFRTPIGTHARGTKRGEYISYTDWNSTLEALNEVITFRTPIGTQH